MLKRLEVELRGTITQEQYNNLNKFFQKEGKFIDHKDRIVVCYPDPETGSLVEQCLTDIRVRTTNGIPEIIIKQGEWGGSDESRRELSVVGKKGDFDKMIVMMAALGHKTGIMAVRKGKVYEYQGVEFSLVEVPNHSYYFEAEIMVTAEKDKAAATKKVKNTCEKLGLKVLDKQGFYDYINKLNAESNETFNFADYKEGYFKKRFGI
jgi:predicted adenylyl cyclase CyaB